MRKKQMTLLISLISFFILAFVNIIALNKSIEQPGPDPDVLGESEQDPFLKDKQAAKVTKVHDGDTIEVQIGDQKINVRYVGIDTPETVDPRRPVGCFGREASDENKSLIEGKIVFLEKDISETDKYNRLLRYVYTKLDDGSVLFVNDYLVREGFANVYTYPPDVKYNERFLEAEKEARNEGKGLWIKCR